MQNIYIQIGFVNAVLMLIVGRRVHGEKNQFHDCLLFSRLVDAVLLVNIVDTLGWLLDGRLLGQLRLITNVVDGLNLIATAATCWCWVQYVQFLAFDDAGIPGHKNYASTIVFAVQALAIAAAIPTRYFYYIDEAGIYRRSTGYVLTVALCLAQLVYAMVLCFVMRRRAKSEAKREELRQIGLIVLLPIVAATVQGCIGGTSLIWTYMSLVIVSVYIHIQDKRRALENEAQRNQLRAALQQAQEASRAKTEFLSNISHDIRTPLNAILNLNEMVKTELDDPEQALSDLDKIGASGEFLLGLINDILDLSKVENGQTNLANSLYPFAEFKHYLESVIVPLCAQKNIRVHLDLKPSCEMILTDRTRFNQIFFNILSNAVKYNHEGGHVSLTSQVLWVKDGQAGVNYLVEDDGIGMSEEFQKRLFQPFAREDTTGAYSGTGLGMHLTKAIVEKMGGKISVVSKKNAGTKFTVYLVLNLPTAAQMEEYRRARLDEEANRQKTLDVIGHGKRVLIAEDHPLNREILTRLLGKYGIISECAGDGRAALDSFLNHMPHYYDAILMDIRMPVMDGLEATRQIRTSAKADARDIPILAMTGNAFQEDIQKAKEAGITEYLTKPIEPSKLTDALAAVFAKGGKKAAVLIVDDVELNREAIKASLTGVDSYLAEDGRQAWELLEAHPEIEVVITDIQMPGMDGVELTRRIRAERKYDHVSVIVNTQHGDSQQEEALLDLGANDFVYKPATPKIIQLRVKNALGAKADAAGGRL